MVSQKHFYKMMMVVVMIIHIQALFAQDKDQPRVCGSDISYQQLVGFDKGVGSKYQELERFTQQYIERLRGGKNKEAGLDFGRESPIIIPVVVHIVWKTSAENFPDSRVFEQIARLNLDFQRLNTDAGSVPSEFAGVASDLQVRFELAVRDPNCNATNGITRTNTTVTTFSVPPSDAQATDIAFNPIKSAAAGGVDAWPADRYLNIWVGNIAAPVLGYSSFPRFPANVDGVVIDHAVFGNTSGSFDLGRTATHEIGHYLNLFHTFQPDGTTAGCFGNTDSTCNSSGDRVCDTPSTNAPHSDCPSTNPNTCTETPTDHHDQWMNYMDYVDDRCMFMFTSGQKERVDACLYGARSSLLASDALIPVTTGSVADLWSQDKPDDIGDEPNNISDAFYQSGDIWIRTTEGTTIQEHQNPVSNAANHVYVRVRNRVCGANGTATVRLFWAKASPSLSWPAPWDGSIVSPAMGGEVSAASVTLTGATSDIVHFTWNTPNIADYAAMGADAGHFCLLARIETAAAPGFGLANPNGTGDLNAYVKNNNNIVWKNVDVVSSSGMRVALVVGNMSKAKMKQSRFVFTSIPDKHDMAFNQVGTIRVTLTEALYAMWEKAGKKGEGILETKEKFTLEVKHSGAYMDGFVFSPWQLESMRLAFEFTTYVPWSVHKAFHVVVDHYAEKQLIGGQDFTIRTPKTDKDELQGGVVREPEQSDGKPVYIWVIPIVVVLVILIWWLWRKRKRKKNTV